MGWRFGCIGDYVGLWRTFGWVGDLVALEIAELFIWLGFAFGSQVGDLVGLVWIGLVIWFCWADNWIGLGIIFCCVFFWVQHLVGLEIWFGWVALEIGLGLVDLILWLDLAGLGWRSGQVLRFCWVSYLVGLEIGLDLRLEIWLGWSFVGWGIWLCFRFGYALHLFG